MPVHRVENLEHKPQILTFFPFSGIFKHSQTISKSYLSDIAFGDEYSHVLGHFNSVSNIGFILGPTVGGHLAETPGGFYKVALLAGLLFFINFGKIVNFIFVLYYIS